MFPWNAFQLLRNSVARCYQPSLRQHSSAILQPPVYRLASKPCHVGRFFASNTSSCGRNIYRNGTLGLPHFRVTLVRHFSISLRRLNANAATKAGTKRAAPKASDVSRLLSLAKPERRRIIAAIIFLFISSSVTLAMPFGIGRVIDIIYTKADDKKTDGVKHRLQDFCTILLAVFVCGALANFARAYLLLTSSNRIINALRTSLFSSVVRQEVAFFDKNKTGELINRLSADTSLVGQTVTTNISDGLRSSAQALGGISMMVFTSPKLALIALGIVPPVALLSRVYGRYTQRITRSVQDSLADATHIAEEKLSNIRTVRAFAREEREIAAYESKTNRVLDLSQREALARGVFWAMTGFSGNIIVLSVMYAGGTMMSESQITVGALSSFLLYAAFVGVSIGGLGSFYTELMRGIGASSRLWELVDRQPQIPLTGGKTFPSSDLGNIEFRDVSFCYETRSDRPIFDGLNLTVPRGSVTAVVGSSGSGKSTLASLLLRYYDPTAGRVLIGDTDVRELDAQWLRRQIGVVSQEPTLFSASIADNILYGSEDPRAPGAMEKVIEAARMANAYNFVTSFSEGFDTLVGERGVLLSGGQKQRIAIARAIIKNPRILLLDEATSALDSESERLVQEALERVMVGRTVVVIAHRLSTIRNAHQIAMLDGGKIVELGSYEKLMNLEGGLFRRLVERQTIAA